MSRYETTRPSDDIVGKIKRFTPIVAVVGILSLFLMAWIIYKQFRIDVPERHIAVLTKMTGKDLSNEMEVAPDETYKGLQLQVMNEGRKYVNPYVFSWEIYPQVEIPEGWMGIRTRVYGNDLGYGDFLAKKNPEKDKTGKEIPSVDVDKGVIPEVLRPGRYAINAIVYKPTGNGQWQVENGRDPEKRDYVEIIELHRPVTIPAGYRGVLTNLAGPLPKNEDDYEPTGTAIETNVKVDEKIEERVAAAEVEQATHKSNQLLVKEGFRGVQKKTLGEGTYYKNPYMWRIEAIDCRSHKFNLADNKDMGFPSKDGFWVSLDGIIEFRVHPDRAAEVYVTYNEAENDQGQDHAIDEEITRKVIMSNSRAFCRLRGSDFSGRELIGGVTRSEFQGDFETAITHTCGKQGIDIVQALITTIVPPEKIAAPVREREVLAQQLEQYVEEQKRAEEEALLATETAKISQKEQWVEAKKGAIEVLAEASKEQAGELEEANQRLKVAEEELKAAQDKAEAIKAEKRAEAAVIVFQNEADAAGWKKSVEALGGDGSKYGQYVLFQKIAPSFREIMTNTNDDTAFMRIFEQFVGRGETPAPIVPTTPKPSN